MNEAERRVLADAAKQYGSIHRAHARRRRDVGPSDRPPHRTRSGGWSCTRASIESRVRTATTRQRVLAATLWQGDDCAVSHLAAGRLLRLDGVPAPTAVDVSSPTRRGEGVGRHRRAPHAAGSHRPMSIVDLVPCTSATRTIIDLAAVLDAETLEHRVRVRPPHPADRAGRTVEASRGVVRRGRAGTTRAAICWPSSRTGRSSRRLEVKVARLLRSHGLHTPSQSASSSSGSDSTSRGRRSCSRVECDGFEWHGNRAWRGSAIGAASRALEAARLANRARHLGRRHRDPLQTVDATRRARRGSA